MKILFGIAFLAAGAATAFAASDGNYRPERQHCSGGANNSANKQYAEPGCQNFALTISDGAGHEYFGIGTPQTPNKAPGIVPDALPFGTFSSTHEIAYWYDLGADQGGCKYTLIDLATGAQTQSTCPWFVPLAKNNYGPDVAPDPASGLRLYFGADDNLAGGEHDSSTTVDNGPSDGGAIVLNLNPSSLGKWLGYLRTQDAGKLLVHPVPLVDGGFGACADGLCVSLQSTRRDQTYPDGTSNYQAVSDYSGHHWDPQGCSGANGVVTNEKAECGNRTIEDWNNENRDPAVEPGFQVYEDPDAQGSPLLIRGMGGFYPLPALYVGTCGVIVGGGTLVDANGNPRSQQPTQLPPTAPVQAGAPYVNNAGQLVIPTGCDQTADGFNAFGPLGVP